MSEAVVARRYAQAIYDLLKEGEATDVFVGEVAAYAREISATPELANFFFNPTVQKDYKIRAIKESTTGMNPHCTSFLALLARKGRLSIIDSIIEAYEAIYNNDRNRVVANVSSAFSLDSKQVEAVRETLAQITGKEIEIQSEVDAELIGGVTAQIGSVVYDGSVRGHLERMKDSLVRA
ncbi:ATP synthase F1 subunit delta [Desulfurispira natronophila]|uniref:ATP synthase subunit delta n=1 Tax=Desulfurispira natronophila TaxID=682562 RepID=A0A7W7Y3E4_9BACT|nr:F-type H+-transporting ATPase subunit delta [Desulfurispira natronophila]